MGETGEQKKKKENPIASEEGEVKEGFSYDLLNDNNVRFRCETRVTIPARHD